MYRRPSPQWSSAALPGIGEQCRPLQFPVDVLPVRLGAGNPGRRLGREDRRLECGIVHPLGERPRAPVPARLTKLRLEFLVAEGAKVCAIPMETSAAKGLLSDSERGEVVNMVAENPEMGLWARRLGDTGRRYRSPHDRSARSGQRTGEGHPARPALSGRGGSRPSSGSRRALQPWDSRCRSLESLTWRLAA